MKEDVQAYAAAAEAEKKRGKDSKEDLEAVARTFAEYTKTLQEQHCHAVTGKRGLNAKASQREQLKQVWEGAKLAGELQKQIDGFSLRLDTIGDETKKIRNDINIAKGAIRVFARVRCWLKPVDWKFLGDGVNQVGTKERGPLWEACVKTEGDITVRIPDVDKDTDQEIDENYNGGTAACPVAKEAKRRGADAWKVVDGEKKAVKPDAYAGDNILSCMKAKGCEKKCKCGKTHGKTFEVTKVFGWKASQENIFVEVDDFVSSSIDGYNATIFSYGQTGR